VLLAGSFCVGAGCWAASWLFVLAGELGADLKYPYLAFYIILAANNMQKKDKSTQK
jgi:NO-binding membrane sensor protein with MHYT domain